MTFSGPNGLLHLATPPYLLVGLSSAGPLVETGNKLPSESSLPGSSDFAASSLHVDFCGVA